MSQTEKSPKEENTTATGADKTQQTEQRQTQQQTANETAEGPQGQQGNQEAETEEKKESPDEQATLKDQIIRLHADLENMRRRHSQELSKAHAYGLEKCFKELMPVIDSLGMALDTTDEAQHDNPLYQGVELTRQMLLKALEQHGLSNVHPEPGAAFDPQEHEAMTTQPSKEIAPNAIVQVIQSGYKLNDRLLRPARVIVAIAQSE